MRVATSLSGLLSRQLAASRADEEESLLPRLRQMRNPDVESAGLRIAIYVRRRRCAACAGMHRRDGHIEHGGCHRRTTRPVGDRYQLQRIIRGRLPRAAWRVSADQCDYGGIHQSTSSPRLYATSRHCAAPWFGFAWDSSRFCASYRAIRNVGVEVLDCTHLVSFSRRR